MALVPGADGSILRACFASPCLKDIGRAAASSVGVVRAALERGLAFDVRDAAETFGVVVLELAALEICLAFA